MFETTLRITFISEWHIGSGFGSGAVADAVINRDVHGIPWIPGSAIKGALREASWRLALCDEKNLKWLTEFFFGKQSQSIDINRPGRVFAGDGHLAPDLYDYLLEMDSLQRKECVEDMTVIRQQTELDRDKIVVPQSLRAIECGIPGLTFLASFEASLDPDWEPWFSGYLRAICACVKSVGGYRSRGLGRCHISPVDSGKEPVTLPGPIPASLSQLKPGKNPDENN